MYKYKKPIPSTLLVNSGYEGETIEDKVRRILNNKEPISDGAPLVYTERKDGVAAETNIRTDRFEIALDAHEKIHGAKLAKREQAAVIKLEKEKPNSGDPSQ